MAASMNWRQILNDHKLFQSLKKSLDKIKPELDSKDTLAIHDGEIFVWNPYNSSILTTNLKLLVGKNESSQSIFQTLLCTNPPSFNVDQLLFSPSGSYLAVIGKKGVSVLELPQKWGKYAEFEGGKQRILCRTTPVAERFFLSTRECVLNASWHPGSDNDMYLVLLMSDNTIRIYNLASPQSAEQTHHLGESEEGPVNSRLRFQSVLGESAISFDFGPPIELQPKRRVGVSVDESNKTYVWPLYILWGNGDVYVLNTTVSSKRQLQQELQGPLSMYPPAEDNYGTDACSISCLYTKPPTLVIATSEGKLHHCVLLSVNDGGDDTRSEISVTSESTVYETTVSTQRLYVYETVELELSLATFTLEPEEAISDVFSCPIRIHKDAGCGDRYHCSHSAGVHTVALPWQQKIQEYCDEVDGVDPPALSESEHSIVEHLVCTKPLHSSPPSPVLGLCMTADRLLGTNLICLTNTYECLVLPLLSNYKTSPPPLLADAPSTIHGSPLRQLHRESFDMNIRKILLRSSSNPLIKTSSRTELSPQECFQLLTRATQVFREEYILKQDLAREEIEKRIRILREHKELQFSDLQECQQNKNIMRENAENLAVKYEDAKDHHEQILHRVETVLKKIQSKLPVLTDAEKNMQRELKQMEEKLKVFKASLEQLRSKKDYQQRQIAAQSSNISTPVFSKTQTQQLRTVLKQEGDEITGIVKEINNLKMVLDT